MASTGFSLRILLKTSLGSESKQITPSPISITKQQLYNTGRLMTCVSIARRSGSASMTSFYSSLILLFLGRRSGLKSSGQQVINACFSKITASESSTEVTVLLSCRKLGHIGLTMNFQIIGLRMSALLLLRRLDCA